MKTISAFLLIMLVCAINSNLDNFETQECLKHAPAFIGGGGEPAYSLDFCRSTKYNTIEYAQCCFLKWEIGDEIRRYNCYPITPREFYDIDIAVDAIKNYKEVTDLVSLDCSSSYLYGSLLLIAALLF